MSAAKGGEDPQAPVMRAERTLQSREVSRDAGVSLRSARRFWRALGFPNVEEGAKAFTEADVRALREMSGLVRDGVLDEATALALTRAVGRSVDRMASWQLQLVAEVAGEQPKTDIRDVVSQLADRLEPLVVYSWRRHMAAHLERFIAEHADDAVAHGVTRSVGFADLVSFTRVVRRLSERELVLLVQRFEATASDIVASHGGRVVKTVGDEVLFVAERVQQGAAIALDIAEEMGADPLLPDVRVGLATGLVVARLGDVYGTTVNRASRLTAVAQPGCVLVDDATAAAVNEISGFAVEKQPRRSLRGIGPISPWSLQRRGPSRVA